MHRIATVPQESLHVDIVKDKIQDAEHTLRITSRAGGL